MFGKANKFKYQRLVGELTLEGFSVSHTKDGVQWEDWETDILNWLEKELDAQPIPLLDQAENFRVRERKEEPASTSAPQETALDDISHLVVQHLPTIIDRQISLTPDEQLIATRLADTSGLQTQKSVSLSLERAKQMWHIEIDIVQGSALDPWYDIASTRVEKDATHISIRMNEAHSFILRFTSPDKEELVLFMRLVAALAVAEITARKAGARQAGTIRRNLNEILLAGFSDPIYAANGSSYK